MTNLLGKTCAQRTRQAVIVLLAFLIFAIYSEVWIWSRAWSYDFGIYYRAFRSAQSGASAYFPYDIGESFVYHPFVLSIVSLLSLGGLLGQTGTAAVWAAASVAAFAISIGLMLRLAGDQPLSAPSSRLAGRALFAAALAVVFAPLWETLHIGQINLLVLVCLVLTLYGAETGRDWLAGFSLALAIIMKTSPVVLMPYLLLARRYRAFAICAGGLIVMSAIAWLQFGSPVYADFAAVVLRLFAHVDPNYNNDSIPAALYRILNYFGLAFPEDVVLLVSKLAAAGLIGAALISALIVPPRTQRMRLWLYLLIVTLMTVVSPLVWYHHSVFLVPAIVALLIADRGAHMTAAVGLAFLIQTERLYDRWIASFSPYVAFAGLPVIAGHVILVVLVARLYVREMRAARVEAQAAPGEPVGG